MLLVGATSAPPKSGKETPENKSKSENPTHVDADGSNHFPVYGRSPGDLSQFGLVREEPQTYGYKRANDKQKDTVLRNRGPKMRTEPSNTAGAMMDLYSAPHVSFTRSPRMRLRAKVNKRSIRCSL